MEGPEALRQLVHKLSTTDSIDKVGKPVAATARIKQRKIRRQTAQHD